MHDTSENDRVLTGLANIALELALRECPRERNPRLRRIVKALLQAGRDPVSARRELTSLCGLNQLQSA